jgi:3-oxocholest-4-en-26-oate---CoA ligase
MTRTFNLADLFEVVVDAVPNRLAVVAGDQRRTYRELEVRANKVAHHLAASGVQAGDHVAILSWNRVEWVEAELGAYKLRCPVINVNYRYVADELAYLLDNSDSVAVVYEPEYAPVLDEIAHHLPRLRVRMEMGPEYEEVLASASGERAFGPRSPDDLYILYTGGTTGMPKGVMWRQEDIFFAALGGGGIGQAPITTPDELATRLSPDGLAGGAMIVPPLMHGAAQWVSFITWFGGGTAVLWTGRRFDAAEIWRIVEREGAGVISVVGDAMARPLAEALAAPGASFDTGHVVVIGSGGAILSKAVKEQLREQLPQAMILDSFGASETGANGSVYDAGQPAAGPRFTMGEHTTVLDYDLVPIAPGSRQMGRLARRGHIPMGYYKDPKKTASTFVVDPNGVRWVVPGDFAMVEEDGTITLLGRGSVCINTGGEKVFPEEVEAALKSHPDVFDVVVVGVPDERFVERVAAVVLPRDDAAPTLADLVDHCRSQIAGYKLPRQVTFVTAIQRTPAGKPDYRWAKHLAATAKPSS